MGTEEETVHRVGSTGLHYYLDIGQRERDVRVIENAPIESFSEEKGSHQGRGKRGGRTLGWTRV